MSSADADERPSYRDPDWARPLRTVSDAAWLERTPLEARIGRYGSTFGLFDSAAQEFPAAPALIYLPDIDDVGACEVTTYAELRRNVSRAANLFRAHGIGRRDSVAVLGSITPSNHYALWGAETAGIVCPINPGLGSAQIASLMRRARCRVMVLEGRSTRTDVFARLEEIRRLAPAVEAVFVMDGEGGPHPSFEASMATHADSPAFADLPAFDDVASYFHTGGTTGDPKLAMRTHRNEVANAWATALGLDYSTASRIACGLPLFHSNGTMVTGLAAFIAGAGVVLAGPLGYRDRRLPERFWDIVERYRISSFGAVPTVLTALLDRLTEGRRTDSLRYAICGGAPLTVELRRRFEARTGVQILEGYGLTEATCSIAINPKNGERRIGRIGLPLPYVDGRIVQLDAEGRIVRDCDLGEIGTLLLRGPYVFPGYLPDEYGNAPVAFNDGWLDTGDLISRDVDGYLSIHGRSKDLIIRGGHNIDPRSIEEPVATHADVSSVAAIGQPDAYAGEVPVVFVALRPGSVLSEPELLAFCRSVVHEKAAVPVAAYVIDAMPLTAVGKIDKPALRRQLASRK